MSAGVTPLVSVVLVTYNQAPFLRESVQSVLDQTLADLELVVVDDGSTDDTPGVVAGLIDPRVRSIRQPNAGPGGATNTGIRAARGRFVALMTGDDLSRPTRLAAQLAAFEATGGVVFTDVDYIDEAGAPLAAGPFPPGYFTPPPLPPGGALERLFFVGTSYHTVTTFAERAALLDAGLYDPLLYQLQDYELLIRLAKRHRFTVVREPLVRWRVRRDGGNLSAASPPRTVRIVNEQCVILRRAFDDLPADTFVEGFAHRFRNPASRTPAELACEQAFLYLANRLMPCSRLIGVERLHALLSDPETARVLADRFGFGPKKYVALLAQTDVFNMAGHARSYLTADTGTGFDPATTAEVVTDPTADRFDLTFELPSVPTVHRLRWEPARLQSGHVRLTAVSWRDGDGPARDLDLAAIDPGTGRPEGTGGWGFDTLFPLVYLPITGPVASVRLRGEWAIDDPAASAWRVEERLRGQAAALADRDARLADREAQLADRGARLAWHEQHEQDMAADYQGLLHRQWEELTAEASRREAELVARHTAAIDALQTEVRDRAARLDAVARALAQSEATRATEVTALRGRLDDITASRAWHLAVRLSRLRAAVLRPFASRSTPPC